MLKFLFHCQYNNGSEYIQNPEDISVQDPKRSCFFDVDHTKLVRFSLYNNDTAYCVNLLTGLIEIKSDLTNAEVPAPQEVLSNFRVIYFRRHTVLINGGDSADNIDRYILGWQANDAHGRNVQRTIEIF